MCCFGGTDDPEKLPSFLTTTGPRKHGPEREEHSGAARQEIQKDFMEEGSFAVGL